MCKKLIAESYHLQTIAFSDTIELVMKVVDYISRIKARRLELGYSQYKVAELAGITQPFYNEIERGAKRPSLEVFFRICEALQIPVMGEEKENTAQ